MMNSYDDKLPYTYSVGPKGQDILDWYRSNIIGGLCNVYRRHINLMDTNSPPNSRIAPCGCPFTWFGFTDVNAMYCKCERENMPLTPGILWSKTGSYFKKSLLIEAKSISFKQIQWLYYIEATECMDKNGNRVTLEHGYHRGEKKFGGYLPDGYMLKDGRHYFFEFLGCYFHSGCCIPNDQLRDGWEERQEFTEQKHLFLGNQGNLKVIRECEWDTLLQTMERPDTTMGRILYDKETEETLLKAILDGKVFGFAEVDVSTPDDVIEEYKDFLFPPLIVRKEITDEMICPFMKEKLLEQNRKHTKETIVQCFHAENHLLMTNLIQFYHNRGLKISNLRRFVQYVPGKPFEPFVETCYRNRVEACKNGDTTRSNTIKNIANSGYGKCSERVADHKRVQILCDEDKVAKLEAKPHFVDYKEFIDENNELKAWQITMRKRKVKDNKPVHLALAILQHSKLLFLE